MNPIAKRTITALTAAALVVTAFCYLPFGAIAPALVILAALVQTEFCQMVQRKYPVNTKLAVVGGVAYLVAKTYWGLDLAAPTIVAMLMATLFGGGKNPIGNAAVTLLSFLYIPYMVGYFIDVARVEVMMLFALLALTKISDMGGFAFGVSMGKHKMCPAISPKKSWEGLAGSIFASSVIALLLRYLAQCGNFPRLGFLAGMELWQVPLIGAGIAIAGTLGDLVESRFKRECEVKDSSAFMPAGMGGFLDMFDSILFIPALYVFFEGLK